MSSFVIKQKKKVKVEIYGEHFELHKPTVGQIEEMQSYAHIEGSDPKQVFDKITSYLDFLGLPKEFSLNMEIDHLMELINFLSGELNFSKKNSEVGPS